VALPAEGVERPPLVILGHGLGGTREMRLDVYAEAFASAGIAALAFTYRHFGDSGGEPRQLLSVKHQLQDWDAAIAYAKTLESIDGARIAIWGTSFGGGHAIEVAARHPELAAAVSQCPFTNGLASSLTLGVRSSIKTTRLLVADLLAIARSRPPVMVALAGAPGPPR